MEGGEGRQGNKWRVDGRAGEENSALRGTPPVLYPS